MAGRKGAAGAGGAGGNTEERPFFRLNGTNLRGSAIIKMPNWAIVESRENVVEAAKAFVKKTLKHGNADINVDANGKVTATYVKNGKPQTRELSVGYRKSQDAKGVWTNKIPTTQGGNGGTNKNFNNGKVPTGSIAISAKNGRAWYGRDSATKGSKYGRQQTTKTINANGKTLVPGKAKVNTTVNGKTVTRTAKILTNRAGVKAVKNAVRNNMKKK